VSKIDFAVDDNVAVTISISLPAARDLIYILSNEMQSSDNGLLRKMKAQHLSDDMIVRLFSDLIIAAGDTVSCSFAFFLCRRLFLLLLLS